jgi:diacylglycerol O-acyltransferase
MSGFAPPEAAVFMMLESAQRPAHMAALQLFTPPEGSGSEFVRETYAAMRACTDVAPMFAWHPVPTRRGTSTVRWCYDHGIDIDYHLRRMSLPAPGGQRELFELISRLNSRMLERHKPLWEVTVIDGLNDGRFAVFTKVHHALSDGVFFLKLLRQSLSTDPHDNRVRGLWSQTVEPPPGPRGEEAPDQTWLQRFGSSVSVIRSALHERELFPTFRAPRTMFDTAGLVPWNCSAPSWSIQRMKDVASAVGVTVNDVALAMTAGALRALLAENNQLPDNPLVAMVPISLRTEHDVDGRNLMGCALCNLATDLDDPLKRLERIRASMLYNKQVIRKLPRQLAIHLMGVICAPVSDGSGLGARVPPHFNVGISHISEPREPLYLNGGRLDTAHPFPPTLRGHALNIGMASNATGLNFGIVGSAEVLGDPECLLGHLETSLKDLERAVGL